MATGFPTPSIARRTILLGAEPATSRCESIAKYRQGGVAVLLAPQFVTKGQVMNRLIYIVGLVVVILVVLAFFGLR
jgi:hypothetical protein